MAVRVPSRTFVTPKQQQTMMLFLANLVIMTFEIFNLKMHSYFIGLRPSVLGILTPWKFSIERLEKYSNLRYYCYFSYVKYMHININLDVLYNLDIKHSVLFSQAVIQYLSNPKTEGFNNI